MQTTRTVECLSELPLITSKVSYSKTTISIIKRAKILKNYKVCHLHIQNRICQRCLNTEGEYIKTDIQMLTRNDESNHLYIHSYSALGFELSSGSRIFGPIALFPKTVLHWNIKGPAFIDEASLALFPMLEPKLDIVVIGYGDRNNIISNKVFKYLKSHNINAEILPTETACATFNFLNLERRYVAAALIPVLHDVKINPDDSMFNTAKLHDRENDIEIKQISTGEFYRALSKRRQSEKQNKSKDSDTEDKNKDSDTGTEK